MRANGYLPNIDIMYAEVEKHPLRIRVIYGQHNNLPPIIGFVDWNYHYKLAVMQIPHNAG